LDGIGTRLFAPVVLILAGSRRRSRFPGSFRLASAVLLVALLVTGCAVAKIAKQLMGRPAGQTGGDGDQVFLYSYFWEPNGVGGVRLALSEDLFHWTEIPGPHFSPTLGADNNKQGLKHKIMREPFLERGPDGVFHMVWTCAWGGRSDIGYVQSADLIHWTDEKLLPVMIDYPTVENCWAPKLFYDEKERQWIVSWASTLGDDIFPPTPVPGTSRNHRIWYVTTRDFKTISKPKVLFDPGYSCIDAMMMKDGGTYYLFFKDERANKVRQGILPPDYQNIHVARAVGPYGPFGDVSAPITGGGPGKLFNEGPTAIKVGEWTYVFYDHHGRQPYYGAVRSKNDKNWEDVTGLFQFPPRPKHGHIFRVPRAAIEPLLKARGQ
jgi:hypothetical protein